MSSDLETLVLRARATAGAGRMEEAEALWREVNRLDPHHPGALYSLGVHALQRRDLQTALSFLTASVAVNPGDAMARMTQAVVLRDLGDDAGEDAAIQGALEVDPYFLPALLARGAALERAGQPTDAAVVYRNVLSIAPDDRYWPGYLRDQMSHARAIVQKSADTLAAHINAEVAGLSAGLTATEAERWREATSILSGQSRPYPSQSNQLHVPRLPALPFHDRRQFAWVEALEAKTSQIAAEMEQVLAENAAAFTPYIAYRPGDPVNQWAELNHSTRWSTFSLWRGGEPVAENLARCPVTAGALSAVGMADIGGLCPNAMFSVLAPRTRIPPHTGETNARLVVHLPLVVPEGCRYRVGYDHRQWHVGETLIFDDTIEHEAINDSDAVRVVLIFDVWNPLLSPAEVAMARAMTAATRAFYGFSQT